MEFPIDLSINMAPNGIVGVDVKHIRLHSGLTLLLGPNGSGKTQILREMKSELGRQISGIKVRYVSAGRLGPLENYRSDFDGQRGGRPRYDNAIFGDLNSMSRRHQIETVLGDYAALSERPDILIKVQERLKKLFKRDIRIAWDGGHLRIFFNRTDVECDEYSSAREASGLLHLVSILSCLYDDEVKAVLIDEPEVSLHPQLQSFLYQEIRRFAGNPDNSRKKIVVLSTHSTEFIQLSSVDDLANIVFCNDIYNMPVQIDPSLDEFRSKKIKGLLARMGQEHKLAFFCETPLLVEGPSDQIMCSGISRKLELNIEAAGSQILPVIGKGQMPTVVKLFRLIGKNPCILVDADALADSLDVIGIFTNTEAANKLAVIQGHRDASTFARSIYQDFSTMVKDNWSDIEVKATDHYYWINRSSDADEFVVQKRVCFCTLLIATEHELSQLNNGSDWVSTKNRLKVLIEFLKKLGCFVLERGTIEAYYQFSSQLTSVEKPNASAHEVTNLYDISQDRVVRDYQDIVDAIMFISNGEEVNEGYALRELVLAIVAPALAKLTTSTTEHELNTSCKSLFGKKANLFRLSTLSESKLTLKVELLSEILDVDGFPLSFPIDSNPIDEINRQMGLL